MSIRAIPCPKCRRVPTTSRLEQGDFAVSCHTVGCKMGLYCLGKSEDDARACWNGRIDAKDY